MSKQSKLALLLNGREYREEITDLEAKQAFNDGLIVVHGESDDICYFAGYFSDEKGAFEGNTWYWTGEEFKSADEIEEKDGNPDDCKFWVEQQWCPTEFDGSWKFSTNIPNTAEFIIKEGEEIYGNGLVISIENLK